MLVAHGLSLSVCIGSPLAHRLRADQRRLAPADAQLDAFLREGTATNPCDGTCSFPALGGCAGDPEPTNVCVP